MKPFKLEAPVARPVDRRERIIYTKNQYVPKVQTTGWNDYYQSLPFDNDPYHPLNLHQQHHNHFGYAPTEPLTTTTQIMLKEILQKPALDEKMRNLDRNLLNYYSFKDTLSCTMEEPPFVCPIQPKDPYLSTMQHDYTPPYPKAMERISFPKHPPLQNQKVIIEETPSNSQCKFLDDCLSYQRKKYQGIKGYRWVSFNPCTYLNTDGSIPPEKKQGCTKLSFS